MPREPRNQAKIDEQKAEAKAANRRLASAYADLFGHSEAARSPIQQLVWNDLIVHSGIYDGSIRTDQIGRVDGNASLMKDGSRQLMIHVMKQITKAGEPPES